MTCISSVDLLLFYLTIAKVLFCRIFTLLHRWGLQLNKIFFAMRTKWWTEDYNKPYLCLFEDSDSLIVENTLVKIKQALLALQICGQVTLFSRHSHRKTLFSTRLGKLCLVKWLGVKERRELLTSANKQNNDQTIKLQHGVRGVWNHRFGWTVHGGNRRWRYCSNALSTAVRLECAGI